MSSDTLQYNSLFWFKNEHVFPEYPLPAAALSKSDRLLWKARTFHSVAVVYGVGLWLLIALQEYAVFVVAAGSWLTWKHAAVLVSFFRKWCNARLSLVWLWTS